MCEAGRFDAAIAALEEAQGEPPTDDAALKSCFVRILTSLSDRQSELQEEWLTERNTTTTTSTHTPAVVGEKAGNANGSEQKSLLRMADKIVRRLLESGKTKDVFLPSAEEMNHAIRMWGSSVSAEGSSEMCGSYLGSLWSLYREKKDERFVPLYESYRYAVSACSARDRGQAAAERAEGLWNEMEALCREHPRLTPKRSIANGVLNAWSKSGQKFKKGKKCEKLLDGMIEIARREGRQEMAPDTSSFNIVLNALAQGKEKNAEMRAEALLERMEALASSSSSSDDGVAFDCQPDEISYNTVLNCWAMSRQNGAADRATAILGHMKKRNEVGLTTVHPDWSTYTTVLKAWARSRDVAAINHAEDVFSEYRAACEDGRWGFSHSAIAYNSMINCYAKSKDPDAGKRALELFETMKANMGKPGWELCFVDIYTYTSLIDTMSKQQSYEASEKAIALLEEVEESFAKTGDVRFQPNIRLYTSVVNAIGRSHKNPERAKAIVDRVESSYTEGMEGKPDVVFYNALINAYGWSDTKQRSIKSYEILKHMISLYETGKLPDAKPDTVTFNSVLNACAHEQTNDESQKESTMKTVVEVFELLNGSPEYGRPDQRTYVQVLASIASHMKKDDEKRTPMAEATFLRCASNGLVGPLVIPRLHAVVPASRFERLMGPASKGDGKRLKFDVSELPPEWTANALTRYSRNGKRSRSRRVRSNFQVTKNVLSASQRNENNRKTNLTKQQQ